MAAVTSALPALAVHNNETLLFFTLLELAIIVAAAHLAAALARRIGQSEVVGEIVVGILLGPSLFGWVAPQAFNFVFRSAPPEPLQTLSGLALVLMMFQIGLEFDFSHLTARGNRAVALRVGTACLVLPFALGLALGYYAAPILSPQANRLDSALFIATAFSITALPVLGRIMLDLQIARTELAVIAISAAALNDVVGWLLLALVTALSVASFDGAHYGLRVLMLAGYILLCVAWVRPLLKKIVRRCDLAAGRMSGALLSFLLCMIFLSAMVTYELGIFAVFGAFMMGVILFDEPQLVRAWRERVGDFVTVFFLPIYFTYTGLRTSVDSLGSAQLWGWCVLTIALATLGKFGGAYIGARRSLDHNSATILSFMMNTRGLVELVVINVGLDLGVISREMFTILVLMALVSTVITTPALRFYLPRAGIALPARR
jgi:Kef-type K+ transport system membrane component KefB